MRAADVRAPRTSVTTVAALPGWTLRLAMALVVGLGGLAAGAHDTVQWVIVAATALVLTVRPYAILTALAIVVLAAMYALGDPAPWQLPVLLLTTHLLLVLGAHADITSVRARLEAAVLRDALPTFLAVQVVAQVGGVLAAVLRGTATVPWLVVVAVAGLGAVTWLLVSQLGRRG